MSLSRSADQVDDFVLNPEKLPLWASGLSGSIKKSTETELLNHLWEVSRSDSQIKTSSVF